MINIFKVLRWRILNKIGEDIAHELRTPLVTIKTGISGVKDCMNRMVESYSIAKKANLEIPEILPQELEVLKEVLNNCEIETYYISFYVDMICSNLNMNKFFSAGGSVISIKSCVKKAFYSYPCRSRYHKNILSTDFVFRDFNIIGCEEFIVQVFLNFIKFSLLNVKGKVDAGIELKSSLDDKYNTLIFSCNYKCDIINNYFELFSEEDNIYLWVKYCKHAIKSINGKINIKKNKNDGIDFVLRFPVLWMANK